MEKIGLNQLREMFLSFYESKDHYRRQSYSLIPEGDKSLLIINSGMAPLKPYFAGLTTPPNPRMTTCQKCIRTGDIDNVGYTDRHGTFFEMLGSFSFGNYFKKESLLWGWEFITEVLKMPEDKIWASVYEQDEEAYDIWLHDIKLSKDRIVALGKEDNFWEIGTGPCGPCSEIYFDRGEEYGCGKENCKPGCDCDRYIEFWNHVFTQYNRDETGNYSDLAHKNIDTGMGLERIACIMQNVDSIFAVDTIRFVLDAICQKSGVTYTQGKSKEDVSIRIITDHLRSITFMIADGILPGNEGRGYVLRRLLRRAARHGRLLGIEGPFLSDLSRFVVQVSGEAYPELEEKRDYIHRMISVEEEKFAATIDQGEDIIKEYILQMEKESTKVLSGDRAFKLYDTYGFPLELTQEILDESGYSADIESFSALMNQQKQQARAARKSEEEEGWSEVNFEFTLEHPTIFVGYEALENRGRVLFLFKDNEEVTSLKTGETGRLILDQTPFYAEGGGQSTDVGAIYCDDCSLEVLEVTHIKDAFVHKVIVRNGEVKTGDMVQCLVAAPRRNATARNHTATHLLHKALREILGDHVQQAGSSVTAEGLRFDFHHFQGLTLKEMEKVEEYVNERISFFPEVTTREIPMSQAQEEGIIALFGEKYGEWVRVVEVGDDSKELCGGTHVKNGGQIGSFKIISEAGVASGIRRIEAVTGMGVLKAAKEAETTLIKVSETLKTNPHALLQKTQNLSEELKTLKKEVEELKKASMGESINQWIEEAKEIGSIRLLTHSFKDFTIQDLRNLSDEMKGNYSGLILVFATVMEDKVTFMVSITDDLLEKGYHAGQMIKEIAKAAGGGGGGKADMAQAGGKDPEKIPQAFQVAEELVKTKEY
jgi:alanyl-tRNA synthetase